MEQASKEMKLAKIFGIMIATFSILTAVSLALLIIMPNVLADSGTLFTINFIVWLIALIAGVSVYIIYDNKLRYGLILRLSSDKTYYIVCGTMNKKSSSYKIPAHYKGKPITQIESGVFDKCQNLICIEIPQTITYVGESAFEKNIGRKVYYKGSVDAWAEIKFVGTPMSYSHNYLYIEDKPITHVTVKSATKISDNAFNYCTGLTSVEICESVTSIGDNAFFDCPDIISITIPQSVTSIGNYAFSDCCKLPSIAIPESVTSIGRGAFEHCRSLTSVTLSQNVTNIGEYAFNGCFGLMSVTIPQSVVSIGENAFNDCEKLVIYCEAKSEGQEWSKEWNTNVPVVWDCKNNDVANNGFRYVTVDGIRYAIKDNIAQVAGSKVSGNISIPSKITYDLKDYAVTSIGNSAFSGCDNLLNLEIPSTVTAIGEYAFTDCDRLINVTIPKSVTEIGFGAFSGCEKAIIYCEAKKAPETLDEGCWNSMRPVVWDYRHNNQCGEVEYVTMDDVNYVIRENEEAGIMGVNASGHYEVPSVIMYKSTPYYITEICDCAFYKCSELTSIEIPEGVTAIGGAAFGECEKLMSITLPEGLTSIGGYNTFYRCKSLASLELPDSVTEIGDYAFNSCVNLTSIKIPPKASLGEEVFYGCVNLKNPPDNSKQ